MTRWAGSARLTSPRGKGPAERAAMLLGELDADGDAAFARSRGRVSVDGDAMAPIA